jgi:hypothetical protein
MSGADLQRASQISIGRTRLLAETAVDLMHTPFAMASEPLKVSFLTHALHSRM